MTLYAKWGISVDFNVGDGVKLSSRTIDIGSTITNLPVAIKNGYAFVGWYSDAQFTEEFNESTLLNKGITLYAKYSKNLGSVVFKMQYFEDCPTDTFIKVYTEEELSASNIEDYFALTDSSSNKVSMAVFYTGVQNEYLIEAKYDFQSGNTYQIKALTSLTKFEYLATNEVDSDTTEMSFRIYEKPYSYVKEVERKHIVTDQVYFYSDSIRTLSLNVDDPDNGKTVQSIIVNSSLSFVKGDIISIGEDKEEAENDAYYKVITAYQEEIYYDGSTKTVWYIEFINPELEDIYSSFDSFGSGTVKLSNYVDFTNESIKKSLYESEGVKTLSESIKKALSHSKTITSIEDEMNDEEKILFKKKLAAFALSGVNATFSVNDETGVVSVAISLSGEIEIANICTLTVTISLTDDMGLSFNYKTLTVEDYYIGFIDKYYVSINSFFTNNFTFSISAEIELTGTGKVTTKTDIADEITGYLENVTSAVNDISSSISGDSLIDYENGVGMNYITLVEVPFGEIPIPLTNIVTFSIEFDGIIQMAGSAGIYIGISDEYVEQINISNGKIDENGKVSFFEDGFTAKDTQLKSNFTLDIILKGTIAFRDGIVLKLKLSFLHLNSLGSVYVGAQVGPYIRLTGMAVFEYKYDAISKESSTSLSGGIQVEFGLYIDIKLGIDTLVYSSDTSLWRYKIPIYTYGDKYAVVGFSDTQKKTATVNTRSFLYRDYYTYERYDVLNLKTGEIEKGKYYYNNEYTFSKIEGQPYSEFITVDDSGRVTISNKFKGTGITFKIHVKIKNKSSLIGKTLERDVEFSFIDPHNNGNLISTITYYFMNTYTDNGTYVHDIIGKIYPYAGASIVPPVFTADTLPQRDGYYLDLNNLWVKYVNGKEDTSGDSLFGEASASDRTAERYVEYRLNWKLVSFEAEFRLMLPNEKGEVTDTYYSTSTSAYVYNNGGVYYYFVKENTDAKEVFGYKFSSYTNSDVQYRLSISDGSIGDIPAGVYYVIGQGFNALTDLMNDYSENGITLYGYYSKITYTVKWDADELYTAPYSDSYSPLSDTVNGEISLKVPEAFGLGKKIFGFTIISYVNSSGDTFTSLEGVKVTKDETYTAILDTDYYYVVLKLKGDSYFNDTIIASRRVQAGSAVPTFSETELDGFLKDRFPSYMSYIDSYTLTKEDETPTVMPEKSIVIYYTFALVFKKATVTFNSTADFFDAKNNAVKITSYSGYYKTTDATAKTEYTTPKMVNNMVTVSENGIVYKLTFARWQSEDGKTIYPAGFTTYFYSDIIFNAVFYKEEVPFTIDFMTLSKSGNSYFYKQVTGNLFGKTLSTVIKENTIADPTCPDYSGEYTFTFTGWSLDDALVFGSETDVNGLIKTSYTINASFDKVLREYTITLDSDEGTYADGTTIKVLTGTTHDLIDLSSFTPSRAKDGDNTFRFVGWSTVRSNDYSLGDITNIPFSKNITYYAVYLSSPVERTLTFTIGSIEGETGGTGYFSTYLEDIKNTTYTMKGYDGETVTLWSRNIHFVSVNSLYQREISCIIKQSTENREIYYFSNGKCEVQIDGDASYIIYFSEATSAVYTLHFHSTSSAYDEDGNLVSLDGFLPGYVFDKNYTGSYGTTMIAPTITYILNNSSNVYKFRGWKKYSYKADGESFLSNADGSIAYVIVKGGETITFDQNYFFEAIYEYDPTTTHTVTFHATCSYDDREALYKDGEIKLAPHFPDNSYLLYQTGLTTDDIVFETKNIPVLDGFTFVGWTDAKSNLKTNLGKYTADLEFYARYERNEGLTLTLNAGFGSWSDNTASKIVKSVPFGKLLSTLETPTSSNDSLVFSHYVDANGKEVSAASKSETLYAVYAIPITSFSDLAKINENPSGSYVLTADLISFDSESTKNLPLCSNTKLGFSGTFNGNGYSIGYMMDMTNEYSGFFSKVSGTVFNMTMTGMLSIYSDAGVTSNVKYLGLLAGEITSTGRVFDSYFEGYLPVTSRIKDGFASGLIAGINNGNVSEVKVMATNNIKTAIESNGRCYIGFASGINNGSLSSLYIESQQYTLGVANSFSLFFGAVTGWNTGSIDKAYITVESTFIEFVNGDNSYKEHSFKVGAVSGLNEGTISNSFYDSSYSVIIDNITLATPDDETKTDVYTVEYYYNTSDNTGIYQLKKDGSNIASYQTGSTFESYASKDKLLAIMMVIDSYAVTSGVSADISVVNQGLNYYGFEVVNVMGFDEISYGYVLYLDNHKKSIYYIAS